MVLRRKYGAKPLYTDGAGWYPLAARWARLKHTVYDDELRNVMERFIEKVKDRLECFDDQLPMPQRKLRPQTRPKLAQHLRPNL